jgi:hypothetical protein
VLINQAIVSFKPGDYDRAYGRALDMGANGEQARGVANSLQSGNLDMLRMGQELVWLANVLPAAADGNWTLFDTTGTYLRTTYRQMKPFMDEMSDPEVRAIVQNVRGQYEPIVEDQIMWLAIMAGICK